MRTWGGTISRHVQSKIIFFSCNSPFSIATETLSKTLPGASGVYLPLT